MSRLLIHAGLHRTGTTALQAFLASSTDELRRHGILYPNTGVSPAHGQGQHNIAWQLTRDRRFRRTYGTVDDLAEEITQFGSNVIISSEDFESILDTPEHFAPLICHPALRDHEITLLFYVRDQISYIVSLFFELIGHGLGDELAMMVELACRDRRFRFREWKFQFDYGAICASWAAYPRVRTVVRSYHRLDGDSIIADFIRFFCPALALQAAATQLRANSGAPLPDRLERFYRNRVQRPLEPDEIATIQRVCTALAVRPLRLSPALTDRLATAFRRSNRTLRAVSGLAFDVPTEIATAASTAVALDRLFSFDGQTMIADLVSENAATALLDATDLFQPSSHA